MGKKLLNIFETLLLEAKFKDTVESYMSKLETIDGNIKLYHYSSVHIKDKFISISGKQGTHSKGEFAEWGKSRSFFYAHKNGVSYDTGVPTEYLYVSHIPIKAIYPVGPNPNNYEAPSGKHYWQSIYEQATRDGYKAFGYYLGKNPNVPIIVSFVNLPIDEAYKLMLSGEYQPLNKQLLDSRIGTVMVNGEPFIIMHQDGYLKSLSNTYLTQEKTPKRAMNGYKKNFEVYMWKDAKLDPEYQNEPTYKKEMRKYR